MKAFLRNQENHKDVIELSFSGKESEQLEWEEEMEFNYKGEMYDVVDKQVEGNRVTVRCIPDAKEDSLLLDYQKNTGRNSSNSFIGQLITASFILPPGNLLIPPACVKNDAFPEVSVHLPTTISTVPSPPPDVC